MEDFGAHRREAARRRVARRRRATRAAVAVAFAVASGAAAAAVVSNGTGTPAGHRSHQTTSPAPGSSAAPALPTTTTTDVVRGNVTIAAVGDTMLGSTPTLPPSPGTYLGAVGRMLHGDVVFGNLEGTLTDATSGKCAAGSIDCFAFRAPPAYARDLRAAGFTVMSNANNHSYDFGQVGEDDTVRALRAAGVAQTGLPGEITHVQVGELRVAFLGFAPYPNTGPLNDLAAARALIRRASRRADIVVCAIHAGAEGTAALHLTGADEIYLGEDRGDPEAFAHMAVDAGADLILGSGPHVLRGMEIYRGRLIAYSLGNFAGYHNFSLTGALGESVVLRVTIAADGGFRHGRLMSVRLIDAGRPVPDPSAAGARLVAELSRSDLGSSAVRIGAGGVILPPR